MSVMKLWISTLIVLIGDVALAHDTLTKEQIQQFRDEGTLNERNIRVETLKQFRLGEGNLQRAIYKVRRAALESSGLSAADVARALTGGPMMAFPFTSQPELPSRGTVNTLTVLVDFKDFRASNVLPGLTVNAIRDNIYGMGTTTAQAFKPHESLHEYYRRASQDQVDVQGNVLGWHSFSGDRKDYEPLKAPANLPLDERQELQAYYDNKALFKIIIEALGAFDDNHDFAQYDNDNDGDIDLVTILYAGPPKGWGSFWWAYRWEFFIQEAESKQFDGKRLRQFVFQFVDVRGPNQDDFNPTTLLHEMGHAFGLADYYDYDPERGPPGGVGGLDMMHANKGNQNGFSRWLLDWIKPSVLGEGEPKIVTLNASGSALKTDKAVAIFPGLAGSSSPGQEMFIVENRFKTGNDASLPGNGLLIWHIDASVKATDDDFAFDNSYTERKLIRLMRADNPSDFGEFDSAGAGTYFTTGKVLTPDSTPSSRDYADNDTRISIDQISGLGEAMTVRIGFLPSSLTPTPPELAQPQPSPSQPAGGAPTVESVLASKSAVDLDTLEALDRQLSRSTPAELAAQWAKLDYQKAVPANAEARLIVCKLLMSRWAAKNGSKAADVLLALPDKDKLRAEGLPLIMSSWARNAPVDAAKWYLDDKRAALRQSKAVKPQRFAQQAFEGLYMAAPTEALNGVEKLSVTDDLVGAVDGIHRAGAKMGEKAETVSSRLLQSKSDVVKARVAVIKAMRAAEAEIKDPRQRSEFRKLMQKQSRE